MYSPDRLFMSDLKTLDPRLDCYFESNHDHFVITWKRAVGGTIPIMVVDDGQGGFRRPDNREIELLKSYDTHRVSMEERLKHSAAYMEDVQEKQRLDARANIRDYTKDDKLQLAPAFARLAGGKHNSIFRRIENKPKGKIFKSMGKH